MVGWNRDRTCNELHLYDHYIRGSWHVQNNVIFQGCFKTVIVLFLRLRASEAKRRSLYCSAFTSVLVFFSRDIPSAFVLIEGYFLRAYFSATIQTFQKETQLDALSNRVKTFRKFSTGAILLASKARNFRKFLGFLSILLFFFSQTTANWPDVGTNRRKTMFSLIW